MNENDRLNELRTQYGCGPVEFYGTEDALYERHLVFDDVINPEDATPREQFEAVARSTRDIISQRWLLTEKTYKQKNPKRVDYLSMEFLLGRVLATNVVNAQLLAVTMDVMKKKGHVDPALVETEPDAGLGNGGLGRLAARSVGGVNWDSSPFSDLYYFQVTSLGLGVIGGAPERIFLARRY